MTPRISIIILLLALVSCSSEPELEPQKDYLTASGYRIKYFEDCRVNVCYAEAYRKLAWVPCESVKKLLVNQCPKDEVEDLILKRKALEKRIEELKSK